MLPIGNSVRGIDGAPGPDYWQQRADYDIECNLDVENLRLHYARTCADWLHNFEAVADEVAGMYDEEFVRMWRLYLAGSSAGFQSGMTPNTERSPNRWG